MSQMWFLQSALVCDPLSFFWLFLLFFPYSFMYNLHVCVYVHSFFILYVYSLMHIINVNIVCMYVCIFPLHIHSHDYWALYGLTFQNNPTLLLQGLVML